MVNYSMKLFRFESLTVLYQQLVNWHITLLLN